MKLASVIAAIAFTISPALAEPVRFSSGYSDVEIVDGHPRKITIHTVAPSQEDIRILWRTNTGAHCEMTAETDYSVIEPPQHGIVCFRTEKMPPKVTVGSTAGKCIGQTIMGRAVYYRPNGAFVGQDAFKYATIVAKRVSATNTADVTITESSSPPPKEESPPAPETAGPMPRCPDVLM